MGILNSARKFVEQKARPFSQDSSRSGVISLEEEGSVNRDESTDRLYELLRKTPEVLSLQQAMVDDIVTEANFTYLGESSGERQKRRARRFYRKKVKDAFRDCLFDMLNAGDSYMYKNMLTEDNIKSHVVDTYSDRFNHDENVLLAAEKLTSEVKAETNLLDEPRDVQMVPASTVEHTINKFGDITNYYQSVETNDTNIPPEKMIHFSYLNLNGGTYNFTPMRSIVSEMQILANTKDHNGKVFDNAAIVNKHFNLPDEHPESDRYKHLKKTIKKFRKLENKHRDLVTTGDVEVNDLNSIGSEMEFRELAEHITKVLAMAWGVPPTRIGMSISGEAGARQTSLTHQGYYKRIKAIQSQVITPLNENLWEPHFNVRMELEDPDVQTEIKEAERDLRQTDVALKRMAAGMWDREAAADYLGVDSEQMADLEDEEDKSVMELAAQIQTGRDQQLSELETFGRREDEEMRDDQKEAQPEQG